MDRKASQRFQKDAKTMGSGRYPKYLYLLLWVSEGAHSKFVLQFVQIQNLHSEINVLH